MRRRWVYTRGGQPCEPYEAGEEPEAPARLQLMTGSCHAGVVAPDGTLIDTRGKRAEYKRRNGVEDESDCVGLTERRKAERVAFLQGRQDIRPYQEAAARAFHELHGRRGK